jgi:hypothetical protein
LIALRSQARDAVVGTFGVYTSRDQGATFAEAREAGCSSAGSSK